MKVSDILRVKGATLYTVSPDQKLADAVQAMASNDIGSLVVMARGRLVGMLTFREVIAAVVRNGGSIGDTTVDAVMERDPMSATPDTALADVRHMMLSRHGRYLPVLDGTMLMGVISFYDVAKAVVEAQDFENRMLKAYIRDAPFDEAGAGVRS